MAHKTLIDGTEHTITGGKTLINGTEYAIASGKTMIGGVVMSISLEPDVYVMSVSGGDQSASHSWRVTYNGKKYISGTFEVTRGDSVDIVLAGRDLNSTGGQPMSVTLNGKQVLRKSPSEDWTYPTYTYTPQGNATITFTKTGMSSAAYFTASATIVEE